MNERTRERGRKKRKRRGGRIHDGSRPFRREGGGIGARRIEANPRGIRFGRDSLNSVESGIRLLPAEMDVRFLGTIFCARARTQPLTEHSLHRARKGVRTRPGGAASKPHKKLPVSRRASGDIYPYVKRRSGPPKTFGVVRKFSFSNPYSAAPLLSFTILLLLWPMKEGLSK